MKLSGTAERAEQHRLYARRALRLNNELQQVNDRSEYVRIKTTAEDLVRECAFSDVNRVLLALIGQAAEAMELAED